VNGAQLSPNHEMRANLLEHLPGPGLRRIACLIHFALRKSMAGPPAREIFWRSHIATWQRRFDGRRSSRQDAAIRPSQSKRSLRMKRPSGAFVCRGDKARGQPANGAACAAWRFGIKDIIDPPRNFGPEMGSPTRSTRETARARILGRLVMGAEAGRGATILGQEHDHGVLPPTIRRAHLNRTIMGTRRVDRRRGLGRRRGRGRDDSAWLLLGTQTGALDASVPRRSGRRRRDQGEAIGCFADGRSG